MESDAWSSNVGRYSEKIPTTLDHTGRLRDDLFPSLRKHCQWQTCVLFTGLLLLSLPGLTAVGFSSGSAHLHLKVFTGFPEFQMKMKRGELALPPHSCSYSWWPIRWKFRHLAQGQAGLVFSLITPSQSAQGYSQFRSLSSASSSQGSGHSSISI